MFIRNYQIVATLLNSNLIIIFLHRVNDNSILLAVNIKMREQPRNSQIHSLQKDRLNTILSAFTSKQYLTRHSLLNNLFSSEQFTLTSSDKQFMKLYFGKQSIEENELYEFTYFHKRDKKMLLYFFILYFLTNTEKIQLILFENGDKVNSMELRQFLAKEDYGGGENVIKLLEERVIFFKAETHQVYKLNLHFLPFYLQHKQFLKVIILSDVNQFESGDKSSLQRIYKKIPKNLLVLSFKKQIYDYKFIQKASMPFVIETGETADHYQLHQKVTRNINKNIEGFKSHHGYVVPIQQIDETFRTVIIRKDQQGDLSQYIFTAWPFQLKAYRKIS